ncbi:MAG TPA: trypsin-like peptidase domain-containing protein [Gaiellaceae bacterium]|nr:trypsin-like peptidase domain-containing protein [Gaiellaceae bacterium]
MPAGRIAAVALVAALLGGGAALVAAKAAGYLGHGSQTVVVREQAPLGDAARPVVVAKPLAGNGFQPAQIFARRAAGVVTILSYFDAPNAPAGRAGQGSGFVVSPDGVVLTNAHVVTTAGQAGETERARAVYVQFADGDRVPARIVGTDLFDDVAVIRVDPHLHGVRPVPLGRSSRVVVGQPVAAIGSPFGNTDSLTVGVVSAVRRSIPSLTTRYDLVDAIQTDAPINHGNSGGPLFDARGQVIGINAQIRSSGSGSGFDGVGFAVPIDSARRSLDQILHTGSVRYAYLGIETDDLTPAVADRFGYAARRGALVVRVVPGTGAAAAGLRPGGRLESFRGLGVRVGGDAIVAIDGVPVRSAEDVVRIVATRLVPGEHARFSLVRGSARREVSVTLGERPPAG